jgi:putative hydrolase of the HAD superfamily
MSQAIPEFLYFDLGNVLLTFDHRLACQQVAALTGLTPERVWDLIFVSQLQARYEQGEVSSREFYDEFCRAADVCPDYDALHLANAAIFQLNIPVVSLVSHLHSAGCRLGILSNTCESHWGYVSDGRFKIIRELFSVQILSHLERCSKPGAGIYTRAAEVAGVAPERIFFVDDRQENVDGALRAGWDAVLFEGTVSLGDALRQRGLTFNY